jgi:transcriptional regulator with PAS, ATPase and Fis domain
MGPPIVGISKKIERIKDLIGHVAETGLNIVICGESGVGKEVVAQNLYHRSPRKGKPFLKINCAALPEGLLESELFGYESGAFTGADRKKKGKFELANTGVLLLDEIGDMTLQLQAKLLHVLQSGEFSPLGSEKEVKSDAWVIAATNHALEKDIENGEFREDLYYRLNIIRIDIPPLRERPEDIAPLVDFYISKYATQFGGKNFALPDARLMEKMVAYHWPGNVRQLQNVLKRLIVLGEGEEIIKELSRPDDTALNAPPGAAPAGGYSVLSDLLALETSDPPNLASFSLKKIKKKAINKVEKEVISYILGKTGWNRSKASKILQISYKTLLNKIAELNIEPPENPDTTVM